MNRSHVAFVALFGALVGCGSTQTPSTGPRLTGDEVQALSSTHGAVSAYCSASVRFESIDSGDAKASLRASDRLAEQYDVTSAALKHYELVLREHPDARPPSDDPSLTATPRQDAEALVGNELADCTAETARVAVKRWRARLHSVLVGLPPERSE
jgi:hypothetical protein